MDFISTSSKSAKDWHKRAQLRELCKSMAGNLGGSAASSNCDPEVARPQVRRVDFLGRMMVSTFQTDSMELY